MDSNNIQKLKETLDYYFKPLEARIDSGKVYDSDKSYIRVELLYNGAVKLSLMRDNITKDENMDWVISWFEFRFRDILARQAIEGLKNKFIIRIENIVPIWAKNKERNNIVLTIGSSMYYGHSRIDVIRKAIIQLPLVLLNSIIDSKSLKRFNVFYHKIFFKWIYN